MMKVPLILLLGVAAGVPSGPGADDPPSPAAIEAAGLRQLLSIRRVYVDRLTGGETAAQMRDILISSMEGAKLFILTEKQERADAVLRGASEDLVFTEVHTSSDGINAHANLGVANRRQHADFARRYRRRRRGGKRIGPFGRAASRSHRRGAPGEQRRGRHLVHHRGEPGREVPRRQRGRSGQDHGQAQGRFREGAEAEVSSAIVSSSTGIPTGLTMMRETISSSGSP